MNQLIAKQRYDELFSSDAAKAIAFDKLAEAYYCMNFGQLQKSDFETLVFSLYLDRILDESEEDIRTYSDYTLSKFLGITQSKVRALKVRKELLYPSEKFNWRKSFQRLINNARYEDSKIKIHIPDKNLYLEIENAIEESGGYIEKQLNASLLQIRPEFFIDLMVATAETTREKNEITDVLVETLQKNGINNEAIEKAINQKCFADILKDQGILFIADAIELCFPGVGKIIANLIRNTANSAK